MAVEAGSMEEVVGLTVGKGTTMKRWSGKSKNRKRRGRGDSQEFISVHRGTDDIIE
jgi:ribosomal protein L3